MVSEAKQEREQKEDEQEEEEEDEQEMVTKDGQAGVKDYVGMRGIMSNRRRRKLECDAGMVMKRRKENGMVLHGVKRKTEEDEDDKKKGEREE